MRKNLIFVGLVAILLVSSGCAKLQERGFFNQTQINNTLSNNCEPVYQDSFKSGEVIYYLGKESLKGLIFYLNNTEGKVRCVFSGLENRVVADLLVENKAELILNRQSTLNINNVPYSQSSFNYLYSNGLVITLKDDITYVLCVDDKKVFLSSKYFNDVDKNDISLIMNGNEFVKVFRRSFQELKNG